jgi:hypothetical protein
MPHPYAKNHSATRQRLILQGALWLETFDSPFVESDRDKLFRRVASGHRRGGHMVIPNRHPRLTASVLQDRHLPRRAPLQTAQEKAGSNTWQHVAVGVAEVRHSCPQSFAPNQEKAMLGAGHRDIK